MKLVKQEAKIAQETAEEANKSVGVVKMTVERLANDENDGREDCRKFYRTN